MESKLLIVIQYLKSIEKRLTFIENVLVSFISPPSSSSPPSSLPPSPCPSPYRSPSPSRSPPQSPLPVLTSPIHFVIDSQDLEDETIFIKPA